jgi:hypothetical protein
MKDPVVLVSGLLCGMDREEECEVLARTQPATPTGFADVWGLHFCIARMIYVMANISCRSTSTLGWSRRSSGTGAVLPQ